MIEPTVLPEAAGSDRSASVHPVLRVVAGPDAGRMWLLDRPVLVGREGDIVLLDPSVSRRHVRIEPHPGGSTVTDLGSTSGTVLNGRPLRGAAAVVPGDALTVGSTEILVLQPVTIPSSITEWSIQAVVGGRVLDVPLNGEMILGRDRSCDLVVDDPRVSSRHARLTPSVGGVTVEDLDSSNGTWVDRRAVSAGSKTTAGDGDEIGLGSIDSAVTVRRNGSVPPVVEVRFRASDGATTQVLVVDAEPASPVGQVARAAAAELGASVTNPTVYRRRGGVLLLPEDRWGGSGVRRGDELTLVDLSAQWGRDLRPVAAHLAPSPPAAVPSLPRSTMPPAPRAVRQPTPPESASLKGRGLGWQIIGGLAAVSVGLVIAILRPAYAVFGIVAATAGALALGAGILADQARRKNRAAQFRRELRELDRDLATARHEQAAAYWELSPDVDELARRVRARDPRLWGRRIGQPDMLSLRVGVGCLPTKLEVGTTFRTGSPLEAELSDLLDAHRLVRDVPICVPAASVPSIGLVGDSGVVEGLAGRMLVEAACLHPPTDLRIWVLEPLGTWSWARWLPHAGNGPRPTVAESPSDARRIAADLLTTLRREPEGANSPRHLVVVAAADRPPGVDEIVTRIEGRGMVVVTGRSSADLPSGLTSLMQVDRRSTGTLTGVPDDIVTGAVHVDVLSTALAEQIALDLAPLTMGVRRAPSTGGVGLTGLHGSDPARLDLRQLWSGSGFARVSATLAVDDDGAPVHMAMREHGPHGVIAGITGSGKSELLLSFLAAMALTHSPEDLNLFLIDYKGGATFAPLERLPHIVGMVTDLETDGDLVGRAFTALDAEIMRRKQLLADVGVPNVIDYQRRSEFSEPMPDLLVVIDEFAELVRQREDVRGRLDTVATQGRSLGIHLLLACQSPTGAVSHAVRTNTNLWVCLRVGRDEESREMLGSVAAARLDDQARGRGFIRRGAAGDLLGFQAVRVTAPVAGADSVSVHRPGEAPRTSPTHSDSGDVDVFAEPATELDLIVDAALATVRSEGIAPARSLWLEPLPDEIVAGAEAVDLPVDRLVAHVGLIDRPDLQSQEPYLIDLTSVGNALVCGQLGFGKSTALRRIAIDLARRHGPRDLHLYGLDAGSGSLAEIGELPHSAAVVGVEDSDRMMRLLRRLGRMLTSRRESLAAAGGASFVQWRQGRDDAPWVVLLLDDLSTFRDNADLPGSEQPLDVLNSLLQGGPSVGIHVVIGATQPADLRISQMNLVPERLLFRQAEAADYQTIAVRVLMSNQPMGPPGRAMIVGGHQLQVVRSDAADVERVLGRWAGDDQGRPEPVRRLSDEVSLASLRTAGSRAVVVGVGGAELDPVEVDLDGGGSVLAVVGPHGSGRSTTLLALFESVVATDPTARISLLAPRTGPLTLLATHPQVTRASFSGDDAVRVLDEVLAAGDGPELLLIDDAAMIAPMVDDRLERVLRSAATTGLRCVLTARSNELSASYEPWARYVNGLRHTLLLQPTREEAYAVGVPLPGSVTRWPPGRGLLVTGGTGNLVQVGLPDVVRNA